MRTDPGRKVKGDGCVAGVHEPHNGELCPHPAKVRRKGKWYCGMHDPGEPTGEVVWGIDRWTMKAEPMAVLKRTKNTLRLADRPSWNGFRKTIEIGKEHKTALDAWTAYLAKLAGKKAAAREELKRVEASIEKANKAIVKLNKAKR